MEPFSPRKLGRSSTKALSIAEAGGDRLEGTDSGTEPVAPAHGGRRITGNSQQRPEAAEARNVADLDEAVAHTLHGDKPDPRLRTPMHWTLEPAAGFTSGIPWEPLQPDSFAANVAVQDADPGSLLNHHRRLIRLRAANPALGATGEFIRLRSGADGVLAYVRRDPGQTVLVLANLGETPVTAATLSSDVALLPAGEHRVRPLFGPGDAATLRVGQDGRIRDWVAVGTLAPLEAVVLELGG